MNNSTGTYMHKAGALHGALASRAKHLMVHHAAKRLGTVQNKGANGIWFQ